MKHMLKINIIGAKPTIRSFTLAIVGILFLNFSLIGSTTETFPNGGVIIDMSTAQTYNKGLKPYGLIYDLLVNHNVPVKWAISDTKVKDGVDFTIGSKSFKAGSFIIPAEYINSAVQTTINTWSSNVDIEDYVGTSFTAPIYGTIKSWPEVMVNNDKPDIIEKYYQYAGIPKSSLDIGSPKNLTDCHDLFLMPHADPQKDWNNADKNELLDFMNNRQGYFYGACETVGNIEGELTSDFHFLSENGLLTTQQHSHGNLNYTYDPAYDGDPVMQFLGKIDGATNEGSERIYMPAKGNNWRSATKVAAYQPSHGDADPNEAGVLVYGYTFGDSNKGMVMYEGGHKLDKKGTTAEQVAGMRAMFNFILLAGIEQEMEVTSNIPTTVVSGSTISLSATPTTGQSPFSYQWSSSCTGGSFSAPTGSTTNYTAPTVTTATTCVISVVVTDDCGRFVIESQSVTVSPANGPTAVDDQATTSQDTPVDINVLQNDQQGDAALDPTSVTFIAGTEPDATTEGTFTVNGTTGIVTFTPVSTFTGPVTIDYQMCDINSLCDIATITVVVSPLVGPTAVDDESTTQKNTPVDINVMNNDQTGDAALDPTSISFVGGTEPDASTEGVFTVDGTTGLVTFTPATDYVGTVTIDYEVCDLNSLCDIATITVNIVTGTNNLYPALGPGTLAYEDLWPGKGDYDFNDMVIDYQFDISTNTNNYVQSVEATFTIKASGASFENGFGFQLSSAITPGDLTVTGYSLTEGIVTLEGNGTEAGQSKPTIIVFDNLYNEMIHPGGAIGINTEEHATYVTPVTIVINIVFKPNTYTYNDLDISSFNPFIFVDLNRSVEVHLPDYPPTDLADQSLFGTLDDDSDPSSGRYYKTSTNLPWAINIYESFEYPIEKQQVVWAYLKFAVWAESDGANFTDWYKDLSGYRNDNLIYTIPGSK